MQFGWDAYDHTGSAYAPANSVLECEDFTTGERVTVPIPAGSTPGILAQGLYKQAQKLRRSKIIMEKLLAKVRQAVGHGGKCDIQ